MFYRHTWRETCTWAAWDLVPSSGALQQRSGNYVNTPLAVILDSQSWFLFRTGTRASPFAKPSSHRPSHFSSSAFCPWEPCTAYIWMIRCIWNEYFHRVQLAALNISSAVCSLWVNRCMLRTGCNFWTSTTEFERCETFMYLMKRQNCFVWMRYFGAFLQISIRLNLEEVVSMPTSTRRTRQASSWWTRPRRRRQRTRGTAWGLLR